MQEQYKVLAQAAIRQLQQLTAPLNEGLKSLYPRTKVDSMSDEMTQNLLRTLIHAGFTRDIIFHWQTAPSYFHSNILAKLRSG